MHIAEIHTIYLRGSEKAFLRNVFVLAGHEANWKLEKCPGKRQMGYTAWGRKELHVSEKLSERCGYRFSRWGSHRRSWAAEGGHHGDLWGYAYELCDLSYVRPLCLSLSFPDMGKLLNMLQVQPWPLLWALSHSVSVWHIHLDTQQADATHFQPRTTDSCSSVSWNFFLISSPVSGTTSVIRPISQVRISGDLPLSLILRMKWVSLTLLPKQIPNPTTSHHLHCYHCDPSLWGFFSCRLLEKPLSCLPIYSCFPMICYPLRSQKILFFNVYFHAIPLLEHSYTSSTALKIKHRILTMTAPQMSWFLACLSDNCFVTTLLTVLWSCWPSICFSHVASSLLIFTFLDPSHQSSEGESHSPRGLLFNLDQPLSSLLQHRHFPLISF